jgi:hypothetical protein
MGDDVIKQIYTIRVVPNMTEQFNPVDISSGTTDGLSETLATDSQLGLERNKDIG